MAVPPQAIQALLAAGQAGGGAAGGGLGASGATPGFAGGFPGGGGGLPGLGGGQEVDERAMALERFKPITGEFTGQPRQAPAAAPQAAPQTQIRPLDQDELSELQQFLQPTREFGQSLQGSGTRAIESGLQFLGGTQQGLGGAGF